MFETIRASIVLLDSLAMISLLEILKLSLSANRFGYAISTDFCDAAASFLALSSCS